MVRCEGYRRSGWNHSHPRTHAIAKRMTSVCFLVYLCSVFGSSTDEAEDEEQDETIVKLMTFFIVYCTFFPEETLSLFRSMFVHYICFGNGNTSNFFLLIFFHFSFASCWHSCELYLHLYHKWMITHQRRKFDWVFFRKLINKSWIFEQNINNWRTKKEKNDGILQCNFVPSHDKQPLDLCAPRLSLVQLSSLPRSEKAAMRAKRKLVIRAIPYEYDGRKKKKQQTRKKASVGLPMYHNRISFRWFPFGFFFLLFSFLCICLLLMLEFIASHSILYGEHDFPKLIKDTRQMIKRYCCFSVYFYIFFFDSLLFSLSLSPSVRWAKVSNLAEA